MKSTIANIIPLKRMPRSIGVFDYAIPEDMQNTIAIGQLVTIPLRSKTIVGLVADLTHGSKHDSLKHILNIINETPVFDKSFIDQILHLAMIYGVSCGVMANMVLPPIQKRKLKKVSISPLSKPSQKKPSNIAYHGYTSPDDRINYITSTAQPGTLWLFATKQHLNDVVGSFSDKQKKEIIIWDSGLSTKEQFTQWFAVRNADNPIVFGTRSAVFLPFRQLDNIYIDFEQSQHHKHWDQAPRFHAKDIANLVRERLGADVTYASYTPAVETYYHIHKGTILTKTKRVAPQISPQLIDMRKEEKERISHLLSYPCEQVILEANGAIFIHINKKGYSHGVCCQECKHSFRCPTCRISLVYHKKTSSLECYYCHIVQSANQPCPKCKSTERYLFGYGIEQLAEEVKNITAQKTGYSQVIIDANRPPDTDLHSRHIIIGTDAAFAYIPWKDISLVIFANIDQTLQIPEYTAAEQGFMQIHQAFFYKPTQAKVFVQTFNPDHVVLRRLQEPDYFYRMDLNLRMALLYPPYGDLVKYFYGHRDIRVVKTAAFAMHDKLSKGLTKDGIRAKVFGPNQMHPMWYRNKFWYTITIKSEPKDWDKNLIWLNRQFSDRWKIDPHPISLLHP